MSEPDARDPFLGLNEHIRTQAMGQFPRLYAVGKVLSINPLLIRAEGMNLDREDLRVAQHLLPGWREQLTELGWPVTSTLPLKRFYGKCECVYSVGDAYVDRPEETVEGLTTEAAGVTHGWGLSEGDEVLLIPSEDSQTYYVVEKLVEVGI